MSEIKTKKRPRKGKGAKADAPDLIPGESPAEPPATPPPILDASNDKPLDTSEEALAQLQRDLDAGMETNIEPSRPPASTIDWRTTLTSPRTGEPFRASHSSLQLFRSSPPEFKNVYVTRTFKPAHTDAKDFGNAFDWLALTPEKFKERVVVTDTDGRTAEGKKVRERAEAEGKVLIDLDQEAELHGMVEALCGHEESLVYLAASDRLVQHEIRWQCPYTDLPMKAVLDVIVPSARIALDLKSAIEPPSRKAFGKAAYNFGYHRQAALYLEGLAVAMPLPAGDPWRLLHVVVCKKREHDFGVMLAELGPEEIALGVNDNKVARMDLVTCLDFDQWAHSASRGVQPIKFPRYAFFNE